MVRAKSRFLNRFNGFPFLFVAETVETPLEEQKRIVHKVSQLMALCDELETKLRQAEADSEKLMNAAVQHVLGSLNQNENPIHAGVSA